MKGLVRASLLTCAGTAGVALGAPAAAQGAPPAPRGSATATQDTDTIIVTARRTEERLQDVPISITLFNQQQLTNRNLFNAADLGTYTPSLSTNARYGAEKAAIAIRGFVQDLATSPSVGVYFTDVVAPRGAGSTTSGNGVGRTWAGIRSTCRRSPPTSPTRRSR